MQRRAKIALFAVTVEALGVVVWLQTPGGRAWLGRARTEMRRSSLPSARLYDVTMGPLLEGFFRIVAADVSAAAEELARAAGTDPVAGGRTPSPIRILEIGAGPGALAARLARTLATADIVASDVDPAMLSRARDRVHRAGLAAAVSIEEADVSSLPYPDERFDLVVSTFSLHHWPDQVRGIDEIHRVLRPGGQALVYDLPEAWRRFETGAPAMERVAEASRFRRGSVAAIRWPWRFHAIRRLVLER